jgi:hypothetical protein
LLGFFVTELAVYPAFQDSDQATSDLPTDR